MLQRFSIRQFLSRIKDTKITHAKKLREILDPKYLAEILISQISYRVKVAYIKTCIEVFGNSSSKYVWPKFSICRLLFCITDAKILKTCIGDFGHSRCRTTWRKYRSAKTHLVSKWHTSKHALRYVEVLDPDTFGRDPRSSCIEAFGNSLSKILGRNTDLPKLISYQSCIYQNMHGSLWKFSVQEHVAGKLICQALTQSSRTSAMRESEPQLEGCSSLTTPT
jgi:hypothetical protein